MRAIWMLALLAASGCTATEMAAYRHPGVVGETYDRIVVFTIDGDLLQATMIEETFADRLRAAGVDAVPSLQAYPPLARDEDMDWRATLIADDFDGAIVVALTDYWEEI